MSFVLFVYAKYPPLQNIPVIQIRVATLGDLPSIVAIYNQAVPTHRSTANTSLVTVESRQAWFLEHTPEKNPIFVAVIDEQVAGWCSLSVYRPGRMALRYTSEVSCYVDGDHHHQGVGSALLRHALNACQALGVKTLVAVIIDRNHASQQLFEKLGFQQWGHLPRVLDFDGQECGEFYYGKRVTE